ncbi:MAG: M16 family metallopeptidase [Opitutaceae bacterium]
MKLRLLCLAGTVLARPLLAAAPTVEGIEHVRTVAGIAEYRLPVNDLNILLLEDRSAPVLTFMVTYRVGSRNEVTGTTGATHLLEHLMFKGSKNFHPGIGKGFDTMMDRVGGINNATTWLDRTNYYENLPSDHLELAVQLEADRMRNLLLREEDRKPEMTVVRNEFERGENDPASALDKEVNAAAITAHPYHHSTIGWRSDIERVPIEKLREFYDTFYWPNNATVTVIGDCSSPASLQLIRTHFGAIPRSPKAIPEVYTEEPPQTGPRRVVVKRPGEVGVVQIAHKTPSATHADHAPLEVLSAILSTGKTSRLYRALIDKNLSSGAEASKGFFRDPALFNTTVMLAPGVTHEQAEKVVLAEFERLKTEGVTDAEVSSAINKLLAGIAFGRDGSFAIAGQLNEAIAVGDWTIYSSLLEKIAAVKPADVQRVAKAYFVEDQSTTGWFVPVAEGAAKGVGRTSREEGNSGWARSLNRAPRFYRDPESPVAHPGHASAAARESSAGAGRAQPTSIARQVERSTIEGIDVSALRTGIKDVVTIRGSLGAGDVFNPAGNSAVADLMASMLDKGTRQRDKFAVAELLEQTGATLSFNTTSHTLNFSAKCLQRDVAKVIGLLAEQLREPRFDQEEFAKVKKQLAGRFRRSLEDTDFRADSAFNRAVFPENHPNRPPQDARYLADIEAATIEDLKAFHAACYGPSSMRIVAVGDLDESAFGSTVAGAFRGWTGGKPYAAAPRALGLGAGRTEKVSMPGKTSVSVVIGQPSGLQHRDSEHLACSMGTAAFGSGFFSARLLDIIRNREGLTYGIGASLAADTFSDGAWSIRGTFAPELLEKGLASVRRDLERLVGQGITAEELAGFKVTLSGAHKVGLATTSGLASALLNALQRGYGPEWLDDYPRRLDALTLDQVNAAIRTRLDPNRMVTVLAGSLP